MGVTLTLKDTDLPTSPAFVEFLHTDLTGGEFYAGSWHAQDEESLASNEGRFENLTDKIAFVLSKPEGRQRVLQSYRYFKEMLTGRPDTIKTIQRYRFFFVIGIPRTGGTYMTKQLFRGAGMDYRKVQNALAHDGFPHLGTLAFQEQGGNIHTSGLLQLAEYLTMVDLYFTKYGRLAYNGGIVVPKKFTKGVYSFPLIHEVIGNNAEYIITLRHPLAMVQSVLDKSGGMPKGGIFNVRSAIERWALDDWLKWGVAEAMVKKMSYIDVFLGYWKRYHYQIAMEAIPDHGRDPSAALWPQPYDGRGEEVLRRLRQQSGAGALQGGAQARLRRAGQPEGRCRRAAGRRLLEEPGPQLSPRGRAGAELGEPRHPRFALGSTSVRRFPLSPPPLRGRVRAGARSASRGS